MTITALNKTNYSTYGDKLKAASGSFVSGDIVTILIRQSMRLKALQSRGAYDATAGGLTSLKNQLRNPVTFLAGIPITVLQQESYQYQSDATRYPVEKGAIVSDHIIQYPVRIDLSFEISNWEEGTAIYAMDLLEALWSSREPFDLMTWYKKFSNMVLVHFQAANSVPEWGKITGRATFQQIKLGMLESEPYNGKFSPTEKTGGVSNIEKSAEPEENKGLSSPKKSLLIQGVGGLQELFGGKK